MKPYLLAVDPGTKCGVAIIDLRSGEIVEAHTFKAKPAPETWGARGRDIAKQAHDTIGHYYKDVEIICYEENKRCSMLLLGIPYLFALEVPTAIMDDRTGVSPSTWKAYVRKRVDIAFLSCKGTDALDAIMPGICEDLMLDDDSADACLVGLAFYESFRKKFKKSARKK